MNPFFFLRLSGLFRCSGKIVTGQRSTSETKILVGMESCVAPLTILKGHQTTSRETADHSANSQKVP